MQNPGRKRKNHNLESEKRGRAIERWWGKTRTLYWSKKAQRQGSFSSSVGDEFLASREVRAEVEREIR